MRTAGAPGGCTHLLGWIQEHPARAERCFPVFCKEEDQVKLLTPRVAVSLREKADRADLGRNGCFGDVVTADPGVPKLPEDALDFQSGQRRPL